MTDSVAPMIGILFTPALAKKVRLGTKTQTRRLVTAHTSLVDGTGKGIRKLWPRLELVRAYLRRCIARGPMSRPFWIECRTNIGDRLYVREEWAARKGLDDVRASELPRDTHILLKANTLYGHPRWCDPGKWRPGMHMPKWASQTGIEITELRIQRVQDITEEDAIAEGVVQPPDGMARHEFQNLWDEINGERATWASDPWVWCYTFRHFKRDG